MAGSAAARPPTERLLTERPPTERKEKAGTRTVGVLLAAGGGKRFAASGGRTPKLLTPFRGRPLLLWALDAALDGGFDDTWVVSGATDLSSVLPPGLSVIHNPKWADGQATSVTLAIDAAREARFDAVVVGLADQPMVPATAWRAVADSDSPVAVATYSGRRRNPVRLAREMWHLVPVNGDLGAKVVMRHQPWLVEEVPCSGDPRDVDVWEDLARWDGSAWDRAALGPRTHRHEN